MGKGRRAGWKRQGKAMTEKLFATELMQVGNLHTWEVNRSKFVKCIQKFFSQTLFDF